jgi:hypothetical protein
MQGDSPINSFKKVNMCTELKPPGVRARGDFCIFVIGKEFDGAIIGARGHLWIKRIESDGNSGIAVATIPHALSSHCSASGV